MKKVIAALLAVVLLSACARTVSPESAVDSVSTSVQATLAAVPTNTEVVLPATDTPVPQQPTPTETLPPAATETQTATPTVVVDDYRNTLGAPAWTDSLDNCSSFGLCTPYEDDYSKVSVSGGSLYMQSKATQGFRIWRLAYPRPQNMYLEATIKTQTCSGSDIYGLVLRAKDYNSGQGYYLGFSCDGRYGLSRWDGNGVTSVFGLTPSDAILAGSNQTNRVGVMVNGGTFRVYANGKFIQEIKDTGIGSEGHIGVYLAGAETNGFAIELIEISYWNLP
ncbi:MAG TPA: hypothetical protein PLI60_10880 [Anaerolineaceae bacterium]|nr:hypothetical protein [Anaerolineaceae bacterium]HQN03798.1 hypothetical protein [Anaerolineaceae bacterium]